MIKKAALKATIFLLATAYFWAVAFELKEKEHGKNY
jgi:hypothetical protein